MAEESSSKTKRGNGAIPVPAVVVGKDVLELLSSSMYVDPMTIFREYVQNAADSIDDAFRSGLLGERDERRISIEFDLAHRSIRIRDNGTGIPEKDFISRLTRVGASDKTRDLNRGFRGVGRLAGLGFCQDLVFRSRTGDDSTAGEMHWDCRLIKKLLRSVDKGLSLQDVVSQVVTCTRVSSAEHPEHFFEVELRGIIRQSNDRLLNPAAVYDYLAQVAPVPFRPDFAFGEAISSRLVEKVPLGDLHITLSGIDAPVYRPYRNTIVSKTADFGPLTDLEMISIPSLDGEDGAVMWFAHHDYRGTLPDPGVRGLRARVGNIQIGDNDLFQEQFGEARFNGWTIGEVHVLDSRIFPNGRRDHFEQNGHFDNLVNQVAPYTRSIGTRCRASSKSRNRERAIRSRLVSLGKGVDVLRTGFMSSAYRSKLEVQFRHELSSLRESVLAEAIEATTLANIDELERTLETFAGDQGPANFRELNGYSATKRNAFEKVFDLIYDLSTDSNSAARLVTQIVRSLEDERANF